MAVVGIRELSRDTSRIIKQFEESGEPVVVTREGRPIGALVPVDQRQVEDIVLATADLPRRGPAIEEEGREYSAAEVAEAIGAPLPDESEVEPVSGSVEEVVSAHLASLKGVLEPRLFAYVERAGARTVKEESEQVLQRVEPAGDADEQEVQRLHDLNAGLYRQLLDQTMFEVLSDDPSDPEEAAELAASGTSESLRAINRQILGRSKKLDGYLVGVQILKDAGLKGFEPRTISRPRRVQELMNLKFGRRS